jgi:hypothetical protein
MDELQAILNLKAQAREELRRAEEKLRALEVVESMIRESKQPSSTIPVQPKMFSGVKQEEAILHALRLAGRKLTAGEIAQALERGGFKFDTDDPSNSIYATMKKNQKGLYAIEKIGKRTYFGLVEPPKSVKVEAHDDVRQ